MNRKTLKALHGSINKWIKIVKGTGEDQGELNCKLCHEFNTVNGCDGCPVKAKTGHDYCAGSPYDEWQELGVDSVITDDHREVARAELAFLQSLLPSNKLPSEER